MRSLIVFAFLPFLSGCAGSVIGDAMNPQAVSSREDNYCQSIGAAPGTPAYTDCRLQVGAQRQASHRSAIAGAAYMAGQSMAQPQPRFVNCTSNRFGTQVNTTCY